MARPQARAAHEDRQAPACQGGDRGTVPRRPPRPPVGAADQPRRSRGQRREDLRLALACGTAVFPDQGRHPHAALGRTGWRAHRTAAGTDRPRRDGDLPAPVDAPGPRHAHAGAPNRNHRRLVRAQTRPHRPDRAHAGYVALPRDLGAHRGVRDRRAARRRGRTRPGAGPPRSWGRSTAEKPPPILEERPRQPGWPLICRRQSPTRSGFGVRRVRAPREAAPDKAERTLARAVDHEQAALSVIGVAGDIVLAAVDGVALTLAAVPAGAAQRPPQRRHAGGAGQTSSHPMDVGRASVSKNSRTRGKICSSLTQFRRESSV
jgi:hypothetical protein